MIHFGFDHEETQLASIVVEQLEFYCSQDSPFARLTICYTLFLYVLFATGIYNLYIVGTAEMGVCVRICVH